MGWLKDTINNIINKPSKVSYADTLSGLTPIYSQYGVTLYSSDVVQQALKCIVDEFTKLRPTHIRRASGDYIPVTGSESRQTVLDMPNQLMTTSDFLEKCMWLLLLNYNVFIVPIYKTWKDKKGVEHRQYLELYPILPQQVDFIEDQSGELFVKFTFSNYDCTFPYSDVIHIRYRYSVNEYMGGNEQGQPDNTTLLQILNINDELIKGIAKAMKASYAINGTVKYNTMMDKGKMDDAIAEFNERLRKNESGILPIDLKSDVDLFDKKVQVVDAETLKFIDEKILRTWGVSVPILTGDYTKEQYEAFYQKTLEPFIIKFNQAFTKTLFTARERSFSNSIEFYPEDLIFMSTEQKLSLVDMLSPTGTVYENEKRRILGLVPLPELAGKRYMSLNWIDANKANEYQTGNPDDNGGVNNGAE